MSDKLQELTEKLYIQGLSKGKEEGKLLLSRAREEADRIVSDARTQAAAIISDTVMFKSPTCTSHDKILAERLARQAGVDCGELGKAIF